jgi:hypothetical protein
VIEAAPVAKQTNAFWRKCKKYLKPLIDAGYVYKNETDRVLEMGSGFIQTQTAYDADTLRGDWADLLLLDEYSFMTEGTWSVVGAPMLLDTDGDAWFAFTPNRRNHAHTMYLKAQANETGEYAAFHGTSYDNPYLKPDALARLMADMTEEMIDQEILAKFLESEGQVFRNIDACLNAPATTVQKHKGHTLVMGLDYAKSGDYTVISIGCATCAEEVYLERFNQIDYTYQNQRIESAYNAWKVAVIYGDSASMGEAALDYLRKAELRVVGIPTNSHTQKNAIVEALALALDSVSIQFLPDQAGKAELEAYERTPTKTGLSHYSAPEGLHDDTVIARALMWRAMQNAPRPQTAGDTTQRDNYLQALQKQGVL